MKFCASNIAWTYGERLVAYAVLQNAGFTGLEIAPRIFFAEEPDVFLPSDRRVIRALAEVEEAGLQLVSMQALLFGVEGAALFGATEERQRFNLAMQRAISLAGRLGIANLVFGSPRQRVIPPGMTALDAMEIAAKCFLHLAEQAQAAGTKILIEPNPAEYGTNFLNRQAEVEVFLDLVNHPAVCGIIDTGAMTMNDEGFADIALCLPRIAHVHCSAPQLAPAPPTDAEAKRVLEGLMRLGYHGTVSIEMKRAVNGVEDFKAAVGRLASEARALGLMELE
jgi:sugar phosphate isomerase/epimerase